MKAGAAGARPAQGGWTREKYGDAGKWKAIHQANRDTIPNPDLIHPGQVIKLPNI